nr:MAG TPA: hypothetical protein [Caudoviricetes sp.]
MGDFKVRVPCILRKRDRESGRECRRPSTER